jgi:hypothetical protein
MPKARWLMEPTMSLKKEFSDLRLSFEPLTLYQKFEQVCVLMLTTLIAIIIARAVESDAENPAQHLGNQFRSNRLWCVPDGVRYDLYRHHCT